MVRFHDFKTESRFSFAINAGWNARLAGKSVTDIPAPKTNEPELEAAAHTYGWMRADACEKEQAA